MQMETRKCTACGNETETKQTTNDIAGRCGCGGLLMKERLYEANKRTNKVY